MGGAAAMEAAAMVAAEAWEAVAIEAWEAVAVGVVISVKEPVLVMDL